MRKFTSLLLSIFLFTIPIYSKDVYLGGDSIGIQIKYEGLLITSTYKINDRNPKDEDIQIGDTIIEINGTKIETIQDYHQQIEKYENKNVILTISRNNKILYRSIHVFKENDVYKTGLMLKDEIMGIGTLTFIDPMTKTYGALGHEIIDQETNKRILLFNGLLFHSNVNDIKKAQINHVGEKQAIIQFDEEIGNVTKINEFGIYGKYQDFVNKELIEVATQDEITLSNAKMYTVLDKDEISEIEIKIIKKFNQKKPSIKSFEFQIIDHDTLNKTNGIVQGMSGSPVVQNGKLIGAVTHVQASDPTKGYGLYIEHMIK